MKEDVMVEKDKPKPLTFDQVLKSLVKDREPKK
jgi:hypothetical protein